MEILGIVKKTGHGTDYFQFEDAHKNQCSLGLVPAMPDEYDVFIMRDGHPEPRSVTIHLDEKLARAVAKQLNEWLETNRLKCHY